MWVQRGPASSAAGSAAAPAAGGAGTQHGPAAAAAGSAGAAGWEEVKIPSAVRALVVLNLQSYAGGRNLWGPKTGTEDKKRGLREPAYNDGLIEVVGLLSGYHTGAVMATKGEQVHAMRLCQASGVRLQLLAPYARSDGTSSNCYLQIDGEPWVQKIPSSAKDPESKAVTVEIRHAGTSRLLRNQKPLKAKAASFVAADQQARAAAVATKETNGDKRGSAIDPAAVRSALAAAEAKPAVASASVAAAAADAATPVVPLVEAAPGSPVPDVSHIDSVELTVP